LLYYLF